MTSTLKKNILISAELISSEVGSFFQELGFHLSDTFNPEMDYQFIVDDVCPEVVNYPRLQISNKLDAKFTPLVRSRITKEMFASEQARRLLASYFNEAHELDLVDRYSKELKDIYSIKIHDYLNIGFFVDSIIVEAYKGQFDIEALRSYLNIALKFAFKKIEKTKDPMPMDVSYSHDGEAFTVQISFNVGSYTGKSEFEGTFDEMTADTHYFDSTYFHKKKKVTLSALFFKNSGVKNIKSYFFTEIAKRTQDVEESISSELHSGLVNKEHVSYAAEKPSQEEQAGRLALARKFAMFIRNYRKTEESPIPVSKLQPNDVIHYLGHYPRQEALQDVDEEIKLFIFKLLKDDGLFNGIDEIVQRVSGSNLDAQIEEIQKVLGSKSLKDIEDIMTIKGGPRSADEVTRVKGWSENKSDTTRIAGSQESGMSDQELWEVRKLQLNVKIQDEVERVNSEGRNIIQNDIVRVVAKELDATEQDVQVVVGGIVEEVVSSEVLNAKKLEEEFAIKILNQQIAADSNKEKLESQILRMKKIMDQMKREIIKLQTEKKEKEEAANLVEAPLNTNSIEMAKLKTALGRTMDALKVRDRIIDKVKVEHDQALKHKDLKIDFLEQRIEEVKNEFTRSREFANEEKLEKLEVDNKSLTARLDLANKKVNIISENIHKQENDAHEKQGRDLDIMKGNVQIAQSMIESLKQEKLTLELRLSQEKDTIRKMKEERGSKDMDAETEGLISTLTSEKKIMEDKFKLQSIELKKVEQKLKYTNSQLESVSKKKAAPANQKSTEAYVKQLDQASARLADATAEVGEKRREIVKLKQENQMISTKLTELEKKLAIFEKKVA